MSSSPAIVLHGNHLSQPSRAVYWFLLLNNIPTKFELVKIEQQEHKKKPYLEKNPFGLVPVIVDAETGFTVFESQAILTYINDKFKSKVADHWYPTNIEDRARINAYMAWYVLVLLTYCYYMSLPFVTLTFQHYRHHGNTRFGCAMYFRYEILFPVLFGMPRASEQKIADAKKRMLATLKDINTVWLKDGKFIGGLPKPTIADIMCYGEIVQLTPLKEFAQFTQPFTNITSWMQQMQALPHYDAVHGAVKKIKERMAKSDTKSGNTNSKL